MKLFLEGCKANQENEQYKFLFYEGKNHCLQFGLLSSVVLRLSVYKGLQNVNMRAQHFSVSL